MPVSTISQGPQVWRYREDSGYSEEITATSAADAAAQAEELLRTASYGRLTETLRVHATIARIGHDGDETAQQRVTVQIEPDEPPCPGRDAHDWDHGQPWGSGHGQVRITWACRECGLRRETDYGATCRDCGECYTCTAYEEAGPAYEEAW